MHALSWTTYTPPAYFYPIFPEFRFLLRRQHARRPGFTHPIRRPRTSSGKLAVGVSSFGARARPRARPRSLRNLRLRRTQHVRVQVDPCFHLGVLHELCILGHGGIRGGRKCIPHCICSVLCAVLHSPSAASHSSADAVQCLTLWRKSYPHVL